MLANFSFSELRDRFIHLSQREQWLAVMVVGVALYFLINTLVFAPQTRREQALLDQQQALQSQVVVLSAQIAAVARTESDSLAQKEAEYRQLKKQADVLAALATSVSPDAPKVRGLMTEVLAAQQARVQASGVKTQPVKALLSGAKPGAANSGVMGPVYKHGLDIELRGRYLDLLAYLNMLEETYPQLFWSNATLTVAAYPESVLRTSVFLLSAQPKL